MPSRREFLSALAAAALPPKKILVAGHPWVYAATQPKNDIYPILDQIFEDMSYAGVDAIELMHTALRPDGAVERILGLSRRHSLPVIGTSYSANMWKREEHGAILEEARLLIGRLAEVGGRTLGTSVGNAGKPKTPEQLDAQADLLRKLMALCGDHGAVLNLHNHTYEVTNNEHDLKGTLERIPDVKLGPDLNWLLRGGVDPVDFIRRHGKRIVFAHLRDQKADGKWSEAMGEGDMDYAAIARALGEAGFAGDLAIELAHERGFQPTRPLRESIKLSRAYVRRVMGY
ncbi:MAG: sugar phosphate isomerase/epimerase [Acidobacteriota bacterium]